MRVRGPDHGQDCPGALGLVILGSGCGQGFLKIQVQVPEGLRPRPSLSSCQGPCVGASRALTQRSCVAASQHPPLLLGAPQVSSGNLSPKLRPAFLARSLSSKQAVIHFFLCHPLCPSGTDP